MSKMRAIFLTKYGSAKDAFEIKEITLPALGKEEVEIKVHCSGLNFADVVARRGIYPDAPKNPAVLGYDVAGMITALGSDVRGFAVGDRVVALTRFGGYASHVHAASYGVAKIPATIDFGEATVLATQGCTAYHCAVECTTIHPGDKVLIHAAAGGVGSILVQLAKRKGAVIFGTASASKLENLKARGVDFPIDYTSLDFKKEILKLTEGIDIVFDSVGGTSFKKGMQLLRPGGTMVSYGAAEQMKSIKNKLSLVPMLLGFGIYSPLMLLMKSQSIVTVNMLRIADCKPNNFNLMLNEVVALAANGSLKPLVSKVFDYQDIASAHDYLESRASIGKVVIKWI